MKSHPIATPIISQWFEYINKSLCICVDNVGQFFYFVRPDLTKAAYLIKPMF